MRWVIKIFFLAQNLIFTFLCVWSNFYGILLREERWICLPLSNFQARMTAFSISPSVYPKVIKVTTFTWSYSFVFSFMDQFMRLIGSWGSAQNRYYIFRKKKKLKLYFFFCRIYFVDNFFLPEWKCLSFQVK